MVSFDTIFELRRYRLKPDAREALVSLFEREFIETQEAAGMNLHGLYRDLDDADAFVWFRSFPDMEKRAQSLAAFYGGATWATWGKDANATMVNSDNVLLLRPAASPAPLPVSRDGNGLVEISTCYLAPGREGEFAEGWEDKIRSILELAGARIDATFVTERSPNSFPRLPVREGETVFVWVATFPDRETRETYMETLKTSSDWNDVAFPWLDRQLWRPLEVARLSPTKRSRHGW